MKLAVLLDLGWPLVENEGTEKNMETSIMAYIGTTTRIHFLAWDVGGFISCCFGNVKPSDVMQ